LAEFVKRRQRLRFWSWPEKFNSTEVDYKKMRRRPVMSVHY